MEFKRLKQKAKALMPDRVMYAWRIIQVFPSYIDAIRKKSQLEVPNIRFYSDRETVDFIINKRYSLSRFGDGEFQWMSGEGKAAFQSSSDELSIRLKEVFMTQTEKLLIGIPKGVFDSSKNNLYSKLYWRTIREDYLSRLLKFLNTDMKYADASITRPYIDYHSRTESKERFDNLRRIWDKRHIVIVEGKGTRLGVGNDLFSNASKIERIICPSTDAFFKLQKIEDSISRLVLKDTIILAALGPTATILAYDMCKIGYQVVDIGHIDVEYVWYLRHDLYRKPIEGKSVNESGSLDYNENFECGQEYKNSIIATIE